MQRTRSAIPIAVLALMLLGAGCTTVVAGQAAPASAPARTAAPGDAPVPAEGVAWANDLCGAFLDTNRVLTDQPKPNAADIPGTVSGYSQYFGRTVPALDAAIGRFQAIGPGPLPGGDTVATTMSTLVTLLRDAHTNAKAAVDAVDPASPTVLSAELPAALALANVRDTVPDVNMAATPELSAAAQAAPNCQAFDG